MPTYSKLVVDGRVVAAWKGATPKDVKAKQGLVGVHIEIATKAEYEAHNKPKTRKRGGGI